MKIIFLVPYPLGQAPSQRFRFEQYFDLLRSNAYEFDVQPFLDESSWHKFYKGGNVIGRAFSILKGFIRRKLILFRLHRYDYVFIHRETAPMGPPIFEYFIAKVLGKKVIYDFDDAIWRPQFQRGHLLKNWVKNTGKVKKICKWSYKVSCGNEYLCEFARKYNDNVVLIPTTIDTESHHSKVKDQDTDEVVVGWTGTHTTIPHLLTKEHVLRKLDNREGLKFCVISNTPPPMDLKSLEYIPWKKDTEIADLLKFNIGIMPLQDDEWTKGKCGFKALQYMALGIPAIVSPVGVNTTIVAHNVNGYICESDSEWEAAILKLASDKKKRKEMGKAARERIESHYSVKAVSERFLKLFS